MKKNQLNQIKKSAQILSQSSEKARNLFLEELASAVDERQEAITAANTKDVLFARGSKLSPALIERLRLNRAGVGKIIGKIREVQKLKSGLGEIIEKKESSEGLIIQKVMVPLGVILVIYESRPEVTIDVACLCVKSGNAVILKGGSEAIYTNRELYKCILVALKRSGLGSDTVSFIEKRSDSSKLLKQNGFVDLVVVRGGYNLVKTVQRQSTIPVLAHAAGGARIYVDESADLSVAKNIILNAKVSRPAACNSLDTIVVHKSIAATFIPRIVKELLNNCVRVSGDKAAGRYAEVEAATNSDWETEFLSLKVAIKVVASVDEAVEFIKRYSKKHSEGIITSDKKTIDFFTKAIDAAAIFVNCSTRLHDGYVFGLGSEMGISTGKLHARGPVGLKELTTYKWEVYGNGQIRKEVF